MPRNFISKYWRRIRNKAAEYEPTAARERNESNSGREIAQLAGAVADIKEELRAANDENAPEKQRERCWKKLEVLGIWAAAAVGLIAIIWSAWDSGQQRGIMQGQLNEMISQQLLTVAQLRANVVWGKPNTHPTDKDGKEFEGAGTAAGFDVNPWYINVGETDARNFVDWFHIYVIQLTPRAITSANCIFPSKPRNQASPIILAPRAPITDYAQHVTLQDILDTNGPHATKSILIVGHMGYDDVFTGTKRHHRDWCVAMLGDDLTKNTFEFHIMRDWSD